MTYRAAIFASLLAIAGSIYFSHCPSLNAAPNDGILQQELKQQQLKSTTKRVRDQLDLVIGEFERNSISGPDVSVLKAIRSVLGVLTEQDMQLVLEYLQKSREATDPHASAREATEAYARQKAIITKLKALEAEYRRQAELYELSLRFKEFASRESTYMWQAVDLAKRTEGKNLGGFSESQHSDLKLLQIDQEPLIDEVKPHVARLEKLAKETLDGPTVERAKQAARQAQEGGWEAALNSAMKELQMGKLMSGASNQRRARDQFREIARLLILSQGEVESLRQAMRELEQAIDQQNQVMNDTKRLENKDRENKMALKQAEVVDNSDLIRRDIDSLAPVASEYLKSAMDKMQEARAALEAEKDPKAQRGKAPPKQSEAITNMEQARRALQEQLTKAEENAAQPENALAALKDLQEQVKDIISKEQKLKDEATATDKKDLTSKAPQQGELKENTQDVQSKASAQAPAAAQSMGEAAKQMQKSQSAFANSQNDPSAQQAAVDALKEADQQLGEEVSKLEQAQKELAAVEEMLKKVGAIIEQEQKLQLDTAKEALKKESGKNPSDLSGKQQKLAGDTGQLQQEASAPMPGAASHLDNAKNSMNQAKSALDKPQANEAQPKQTEALTELYAAKQEMENKADQLRDMLGTPSEQNGQSLADASAAIEKAQKNVSRAMQNLQQGPPGMMENMLHQQQQISDALSQMKPSTAPAAPMNQAQKAAEQAAQKLAQSNLPAAIGAMQQAQESMKKAMESGQKEQGNSKQGNQQNQQNGQPPEQGSQSLPALSQQQAEVKEMAESLMAAQQAAPASAMAQAAQALSDAHDIVGPLVAGEAGPLPNAAQSALQSAQSSLSSGVAQANAGQNSPAQASASGAAQSLAQAQAALALAQAGIGQGQQMAGSGQSQGQAQGQGKGQGQGQGRGQPKGMAQGSPNPKGTGQMGNWAAEGGSDGPKQHATGAGQFTGLPTRDRAAIQQSQAEKYPQEYGPMVEQYLKNLSDQVNK